MNGILLAGGKGERLSPLTDHMPKVMVRIGGIPVVERNLTIMRDAGIQEVYVNLYNNPNIVRKHFKNDRCPKIKIHYVEEKTLTGTAGIVKKLSNKLSDPFIVFYGDNFTDINLNDMIQQHYRKNSLVTIAIFDRMKNQNSGIYGGCVDISDGGSVVSFQESGSGLKTYVNAGIYLLQKEIVQYFPDKNYIDFGHDIFPMLLKNKIPISAYFLKGFLFGLDNKKAYDLACNYWNQSTKESLV